MIRTNSVLAFLLLPAVVFGDNWPRFRGPNGDGKATGADIPTMWTSRSGVLWKVEIPGVGNSSPIVWEDNIFLQTSKGDGTERQLLCLSASSGKQLWARGVPGAAAKIHQKNSLSSSTPATDGESVYCCFWDGKQVTLHAFSMAGKPLWDRKLGGYISQHGYGTSPIVFDKKVFVAEDQDGDAVVLAFDAVTGKELWRATRTAFRACYSTPFMLEKPGQAAQMIVASTAGVTSYAPTTGEVNWSWTWDWTGLKSPLRTVASPIYSGGIVFANSGDGGGDRATVAVKAEGSGKVDASNRIWEKRRDYPYVPCMLAHGEHIFFVTDHGFATCAEAKTGDILWRERLGSPVTASPVLINGKVYAITEDGVVTVFAAEPKFRVIAKNDLGEGVLASPAVANNRLFVRTKSHLWCIGKGTSTTSNAGGSAASNR